MRGAGQSTKSRINQWIECLPCCPTVEEQTSESDLDKLIAGEK